VEIRDRGRPVEQLEALPVQIEGAAERAHAPHGDLPRMGLEVDPRLAPGERGALEAGLRRLGHDERQDGAHVVAIIRFDERRCAGDGSCFSHSIAPVESVGRTVPGSRRDLKR
jgi:hypothetical protein